MSSPSLQLRILSFNIRYATSSPFTNEKPWPQRYPLVLNQLQHEVRFLDGSSQSSAASFICLQEVLNNQLVDILAGLNNLPTSTNTTPADGPLWAHVGVGRDDGKTKGEYSPIIYPVTLFNLLHSETVWLSPTPNVPSKGWDAGSIRILTVAVFEHKVTKQRLLASATHLDNAGSVSRKNSVGIILETLRRVEKECAIKGETLPIFLAGDFNSQPNQEAYLAMAQSDYMYDLQTFVPARRRYGNSVTFTGFQPEKNKDDQGRIDFIWLGPKDALCNGTGSGAEQVKCEWDVNGYAVLPNVFDEGVYGSDHRCVVGEVNLAQGSAH